MVGLHGHFPLHRNRRTVRYVDRDIKNLNFAEWKQSASLCFTLLLFAPINVLHAQMFEGEYVCTTSRMARRKHLWGTGPTCVQRAWLSGRVYAAREGHGDGEDELANDLRLADCLECSCVECVELEFERISITETGSGRIVDDGTRLPVLSPTCLSLQGSGDIDTLLREYLCFRVS